MSADAVRESADSTGADEDARAFYGRWAGLYDLIARFTPGVPAVRRQVTAACRLEPGETVVEMGCGTGANLPYLREAVGAEGTVIGVDFTGPVLERARAHVADYDNVHLVRADATRPPLRATPHGVDAVLATFVVGMLGDPARVVDDWCDLVGPGGRVVLANAASADHRYAPAVNAGFRAVVILSTPPTTRLRYERDPTDLLDARVDAAHERLRSRSREVAETRRLLGVIRITGGRVGETDRGR